VPGRGLIAAVAVLACAGCAAGDGGGNAALPDRGTPAAVVTTAAASPTGTPAPSASGVDHTDVLAVYRGWWAALQAAYAKGDADDPALAEYAVDPILGRQRATIAGLRAQGVVQRTAFALRPRLRYQTDGNAEVEDCVRGPANTYYDAVTGRLRAPRGYRNDAPTEDRLLTTLQKRGDQWYVVAATGRGEVEC
jgi:hypothetical protein